MPHCVLLWIVSLISVSAFAFEPEISAQRSPNQSWEDALDQNSLRQNIWAAEANAIDVSAVEARGTEAIPKWKDDLVALKSLLFESLALRTYQNPNGGNFQRRAAWLYVNDGCFAKAAHVSFIAKQKGLVQPGKIYAFGDLRFNSRYAKNGRTVYWAYHVAAAYKFGSTIYILDPAVSPGGLLTVDQWKSRISPKPADIRLSYCDSRSYSPLSRCRGGNGNGAYVGSMSKYLRLEWNNLTQLGYMPTAMLAPIRSSGL